MTILIADHSQIVRLWLSATFRNLNGSYTIRETSDKIKCLNGTIKTQADILVTSSSFIWSGNNTYENSLTFVQKFPARILINDSSAGSELISLFNEVIEAGDGERDIIEKMERLLKTIDRKKDKEERSGNDELSSREKEVLRLVALGFTNKEIASRLFISSHTVITHRKNITAKLGIKTIAGLTLYAAINKLITNEDISGK